MESFGPVAGSLNGMNADGNESVDKKSEGSPEVQMPRDSSVSGVRSEPCGVPKVQAVPHLSSEDGQ